MRSFIQRASTLLAHERGLWRVVLLSVAVGTIAGLGAIAFYTLLDGARHLFLGEMANYWPHGPGGEPPLFPIPEHPGAPRRGILFLLPAVGGLISGLIIWRFAPEAAGHGTDAAIDAYHHHAGSVRRRVPFIKAITAAITIGTGGSGGREGPIAQIGSGMGSAMARALGLSARETRILMAAGMASGVGAIFHAPLAGALFAAEVLYRDLDLEYEVIIPSIIASIMAYAIFCTRFGWASLFVTPGFVFDRPMQLIPYAVLAIAVAGGAWLYTRCFYLVHNAFRRSRIPLWLAPAIGGLGVGAIGLAIPEALGTGYGVIQRALAHTDASGQFGTISLPLLLAVFAGKILTTSLSIGSGGSGGVFGPAIVIGGALGGAVGLIMQGLFPEMGIQPGAFTLVGMAGFFAAAANTPISTIIMVSEMTGNYHLLVPSMWVCIVAYLLSRRFSLYENQIANRFASPVHQGNMIEAVLTNIRVRRVLSVEKAEEIVKLPSGAQLRDILSHFSTRSQSTYPVVDQHDVLVGIIPATTLRSLIQSGSGLDMVMIADDLAVPPVVATRNDTLLDAMHRMQRHHLDEIIVVESKADRRIVGLLNHSDIVAAYDRELIEAELMVPE